MGTERDLLPAQQRLIAQSSGDLTAFRTTVAWTGQVGPDEFVAAAERVLKRHAIFGTTFHHASGNTVHARTGHEEPLITRNDDVHYPQTCTPPNAIVSSEYRYDEWRHELTVSGLVADSGCADLLHRELHTQLAHADGANSAPSTTTPPCTALPHMPATAPPAPPRRKHHHDRYWFPEMREAPRHDSLAVAFSYLDDIDTHTWTAWQERYRVPARDILLATWTLTVATVLDKPRALLGVYNHGRSNKALADVIGPLGTYVPIAMDLAPDMAIGEFIGQCSSRRIEADAHAHDYRPVVHTYPRVAFTYTDVPSASVRDPLQFTNVSFSGELIGIELACVNTSDGIAMQVKAAETDWIGARLDAESLDAEFGVILEDLTAVSPDTRLSAISI